jgi:hypothetical protein
MAVHPVQDGALHVVSGGDGAEVDAWAPESDRGSGDLVESCTPAIPCGRLKRAPGICTHELRLSSSSDVLNALRLNSGVDVVLGRNGRRGDSEQSDEGEQCGHDGTSGYD